MKRLADESTAPLPRKGSILNAASALAGGLEQQENIVFTLKKSWTEQPTSKQLIHEREIRRERFGWEVDFPDFQMPFEQNISEKIKLFEAEEDA